MLKLYLGRNLTTKEAGALNSDHQTNSHHSGEHSPDRDPLRSNVIHLLEMPPVDSFDPISVREATEHLRRAMELDPDNPASERMLKWVNIIHIPVLC
jgi:hypothetical protein